ncbi:MAG: LysR family transcriptional regulator, partial [Succinivibrionaceae bacterium]|nr:LysR family transcriptional regulator [Succinivibrionaceae bacterium]
MSQSRISQQIKALEEELGVLLLRRHNRTFSLTEAGELFYRKSTIIMSDVNILLSDIRRQVQHSDERLRIGYPVNFADEQIINSVSAFKNRYP